MLESLRRVHELVSFRLNRQEDDFESIRKQALTYLPTMPNWTYRSLVSELTKVSSPSVEPEKKKSSKKRKRKEPTRPSSEPLDMAEAKESSTTVREHERKQKQIKAAQSLLLLCTIMSERKHGLMKRLERHVTDPFTHEL